MADKSKRATLADVAEAAGVSVATVSKALNGRNDVAPATRKRVLAAVAQLDYCPTTAPIPVNLPRSLAAVFDVPASPYIMNVFHGVLAAATEFGIDLITRLPPDRASRTDPQIAREWIASQQEIGVIGLVGLTPQEPDALIDAAIEADLPFVIIDPLDTYSSRMVSVSSSNWAGARIAVEHLLSLGHRRVGWLGGPNESAPNRDRLQGYKAALDRAGIALDPKLVFSGFFEVGSGAEMANDAFALPNPPTALMCANDEIAVGALHAAHELEIGVPEEISVVGFDDTPQATWTTPRLTSVHQPLQGMGRIAVQTALTMANGEQPPSRHVELATTLMVRESTGPAPE